MLEHSSAFWTKERRPVRKVKRGVSRCFALNCENMGKGKRKRETRAPNRDHSTSLPSMKWWGNQFYRVISKSHGISQQFLLSSSHCRPYKIYAWACLKLWTLFSWMGSTEILTKFKIKQSFKFILRISNHWNKALEAGYASSSEWSDDLGSCECDLNITVYTENACNYIQETSEKFILT